jgi:hypothetical protein
MSCATEELTDLAEGVGHLVEANCMASAVMLVTAIITAGHTVVIELDEEEYEREECDARYRVKVTSSYSLKINGKFSAYLWAVARGSFSRINGEYEWRVRSKWEYDGEYLVDAVGADVKMPDIPRPPEWSPG